MIFDAGFVVADVRFLILDTDVRFLICDLIGDRRFVRHGFMVSDLRYDYV